MAEAPDSSMRQTLSVDSESGVDETTIGPFNLRPRYDVEKSIILRLRLQRVPVSLPASLEEQYWESRRGRAWRLGPSRPAIGAPRHLVRLSTVRQPGTGCRGRAWCSGLRGRHSPSAGWMEPWSRVGRGSCLHRAAPGCKA